MKKPKPITIIITEDALKTYKERTPNWNNLPEEMKFLIPYAEKYGSLQFDDPIYDYLEKCSKKEKLEILELEAKMAGRVDAAIPKFLDDFPMTKHEESSLIYFLGHFLALGHDVGLLPASAKDLE